MLDGVGTDTPHHLGQPQTSPQEVKWVSIDMVLRQNDGLKGWVVRKAG